MVGGEVEGERRCHGDRGDIARGAVKVNGGEFGAVVIWGCIGYEISAVFMTPL